MFNAEMSGATAWRGSDTESEMSDSSSDSGEEDSKSKDDGEDPFDEDEETLENPLQTPNAEADSDAPSARPVEDKRLFFEVRHQICVQNPFIFEKELCRLAFCSFYTLIFLSPR